MFTTVVVNRVGSGPIETMLECLCCDMLNKEHIGNNINSLVLSFVEGCPLLRGCKCIKSIHPQEKTHSPSLTCLNKRTNAIACTARTGNYYLNCSDLIILYYSTALPN